MGAQPAHGLPMGDRAPRPRTAPQLIRLGIPASPQRPGRTGAPQRPGRTGAQPRSELILSVGAGGAPVPVPPAPRGEVTDPTRKRRARRGRWPATAASGERAAEKARRARSKSPALGSIFRPSITGASVSNGPMGESTGICMSTSAPPSAESPAISRPPRAATTPRTSPSPRPVCDSSSRAASTLAPAVHPPAGRHVGGRRTVCGRERSVAVALGLLGGDSVAAGRVQLAL